MDSASLSPLSLPASTLLLVAVPISLGVICVDCSSRPGRISFSRMEKSPSQSWFAVLIGAFMVVYQTGLWALAAFRISRIICLGFAGLLFVLIGCLPFLKDVARLGSQRNSWPLSFAQSRADRLDSPGFPWRASDPVAAAGETASRHSSIASST